MENKENSNLIGKKIGIIGGAIGPEKITQHHLHENIIKEPVYAVCVDSVTQLKNTIDLVDLKNKTLIICAGGDLPDEIELRKKLAIAANQEVVFLTTEQAKQIEPERGIVLNDLQDLHNKQLEQLSDEIKMLDNTYHPDVKDGRTLRRERRANDRKLQKSWKKSLKK